MMMVSRLQRCFTSLQNAKNVHYRGLSSTTSRRDAAAMPEVLLKKGSGIEKIYSPGEEYHGFVCTRAESVPEFGLIAYLFKHNTVGSAYWHINRDDANNVFSVNFRTTPFDSTGLPHILEHNVLCGSKKYPIRDPFFKMLNRSVATFMNAMTGPDFTLYPFSSMNEIDYRNLQQIYLDAVFNPNLAYYDFLQEGWRLEHSNLKDKSSKYVFKGVVYNEMKGAFSENASIFGQQLLNSLLPDHTYGYVSGGNPLDIPKLTHEDLVSFHRKYYHPSNARFYSYGNFNLERTLSYINENYLSNYKSIDNKYSQIPKQNRWAKPRNVHISSRFDNMGAPFEKQNQIAISLLMSDITDIYETFLLNVLTELLVKGPNSYFYKSLLEPNFSGGYNQTTGYDAHMKDTMFAVGLQDLRVDDFSRVREVFDQTIQNVIDNGFEKDHIESVLHNIELSLKHQTPQFGLGILFNLTPLWNHDGDVVDSLKVSSLITRLRKELESNPKYLQEKVDHYFKNNQHRLTLTMSPDEQYESKFQEAEKKLLDDKIAKLSPTDIDKVYKDGIHLEELQKATPNLNILPTLSVDDVERPPEAYNLEMTTLKGISTQICPIETNQISYFKTIFDSTNLPDEEKYLIPLFCNIVNDMGTKSYDYRTFDKLVTSKTSGIDFNLHFSEDIYDSSKYKVGVMMRTHALEQNTPKMFELCQEILCNYTIKDVDRLQMLMEAYLSNLSVGIANSGHVYAMQSCSGLVSESAKLKSLLTGVEHIEYMKRLVADTDPKDIMQRLNDLGQNIFNANTMKSAINGSSGIIPETLEHYEKFIDQLPRKGKSVPSGESNPLEPSCLHFVMNIPVNYCAKSFLSVPYTHPDHPTLRVLAKFLSAKYLLPVVREQSGAYGAGAKIGVDGIFSFFSYRDPNSRKTFDAFDDTYEWLKENTKDINEQALFESKLGVLQQLDAPIAPGNMGIDNFVYEVSQEIFRKYRKRTLDVSLVQFKNVIEKYLKDDPKHFGKCLLGPESKDVQKKNEKWLKFL